MTQRGETRTSGFVATAARRLGWMMHLSPWAEGREPTPAERRQVR